MPYLLPDGDAYTADRRCLIVVIPDKDEYQRALMGSLDFLGTWVAWERDSLKRGKDAARAWKEATAETRECLMICDDMLAQLTAIETAIRETACCTGALPTADDFYPSTDLTAPYDSAVDTTGSTIEKEVGTPPGSYATWAAYDEALCKEASEFVDTWIPRVFALLDSFFTGVETILYPAALAFAAAALAATGLLAPAAVATVLDVVAWAKSLQSLIDGGDTQWDTYRDALLAGRQDLICAIATADTPADAYTYFGNTAAALSPKGWDYLSSTLPMEFMIRRLFNTDTDINGGGFGSATTCGCGIRPSIGDENGGTILSMNPAIVESYTVTTDDPDLERVFFRFVDAAGVRTNVRITNITASPVPNNDQVGNTWAIVNSAGTVLYEGDSMPSGFPYVADTVYAVDQRSIGGAAGTPFTVTVTWERI